MLAAQGLEQEGSRVGCVPAARPGAGQGGSAEAVAAAVIGHKAACAAGAVAFPADPGSHAAQSWVPSVPAFPTDCSSHSHP